jgi:hypothetical protein
VPKPDPILELFGEPPGPARPPEKDYPGKRAPKNRAPAKPVVVRSQEPRWDDHPRVFTIKGVESEFFQIGALAMALNRKPVTVRDWEAEGIIPKANFRTPTPRGTNVPGKAVKGRRLYSRKQIEFLIEAVRRFEIDGNKPRWTEFKAHVAKHWPK